MSNNSRKAYVVWDRADDDHSAVLAVDDADAVVEACEEFGYGVTELAEARKGPWDVVWVARAHALDRYADMAHVPAEELQRVADALHTERRRPRRVEPEPDDEGGDPLDEIVDHDADEGEW